MNIRGLVINACRQAFPEAENDMEAVDLASQAVFEEAMKAQEGNTLFSKKNDYMYLREIRKHLYHEQALKTNTVGVN